MPMLVHDFMHRAVLRHGDRPALVDARGTLSYHELWQRAARLAGGWGEIAPRPMDFDGTTFRKPGGIAPQMVWKAKARRMSLIVYLGTRPAIRIAMREVGDFSENPFGS